MSRSFGRLALVGICLLAAPLRDAPSPGQTAGEPDRRPDVIYWPTPPEVVAKMLELADLKPDDVLYDLGCGDGRIVIEAAKRYGVRSVGYDIDPKRVAQSLENVRKAGVSHLVTIRKQDIFQVDLSRASVVTMYLLPELNVRLKPQLARLRPGSRVVSHAFDMRGAKPHQTVKVRSPKGEERTVHLWVVPWEEENPR
ncbi:MAG: class I SAM-dependent methyltransferase [Isosphaeraceae bacterium]